ncbi:MAG: transcriptional regulator [Gammaproteobacteria bacterium]|nr:transcriptional regulator [Gammaproteobacteria bacterium]
MKDNSLLNIPNKKYFTISEASELCVVKKHTLRFWEKEFDILKPKTRKGRRFYQKEDLLIIKKIRHLLYEEGMTISGANKKLITKEVINKPESLDLIKDLEDILKEIKKLSKG